MKPGDTFVLNFDVFESDLNDMQCQAYMFNGELRLNNANQKPVALKSEDKANGKLSCVDANTIKVPTDIEYQILTVQWIWKYNGEEFKYCADIYVSEGVKNQKFFSKQSAQDYLDSIGERQLIQMTLVELRPMEFSGRLLLGLEYSC